MMTGVGRAGIAPSDASMSPSAVSALTKKRNFRRQMLYRLCALPAVLVTLCVTFVPMGLLLYLSFQDQRSGVFSLRYYIATFTDAFFLRTLGTTLSIALGVTIASIIIAMPLAYLLARKTLLRNVIMPVISIPRMLPFVVVGYAMILLMAPVTGVLIQALNVLGIVDGPLFFLFDWPGQSIAFSFSGIVVATAVLSGVLMSVDRQLEQAAVSMGASPLRAFFEVTLPLSVPGIIAASALIFTTIITAYSVPVILNGRVPYMISIVIASNLLTLQQHHLAYAQAIIVTIIAISVTVAAQLMLARYGRRG